MEHILNELEDLFQSLVRRMNKSEMEDFELVNCFYNYIHVHVHLKIAALIKLNCKQYFVD